MLFGHIRLEDFEIFNTAEVDNVCYSTGLLATMLILAENVVAADDFVAIW